MRKQSYQTGSARLLLSLEGMSPPVLVQERTEIDVGVALGGRKPRMSQELLDRAEIRSRRKQMSGEAVPQTMRREVLGRSDPHEMPVQDPRDAPRSQSRAPEVHEKRLRILGTRPALAVLEIRSQCL